jgi:hypothetical protein
MPSFVSHSTHLSSPCCSPSCTPSCLQSRHSTTWATPPVHFCSGYFGDGVLRTICPRCPILLISVSQVARITGWFFF